METLALGDGSHRCLAQRPDQLTSPPKDRFDIVIVVPLEEELLAVQTVFEPTIDRSTAYTFRYEVESGNSDVRMLLIQQEGMGRTFAARATSEALSDFDVGLVVCLGIAGSLTTDLRLGDVCYSSLIVDVLDNARAADVDGEMDIDLSSSSYPSPRELIAAINFCRTVPRLRKDYTNWQKEQFDIVRSLASEDIPADTPNFPNTMPGMIMCGAVSKSALYNKKLTGIDRKTLAIETESGGVFEEAQRKGVPALTIRGISDHANADKSKLEKRSSGGARKVAALNAAGFLKHQLKNPYFLEILSRARTSRSTLPLDLDPPPTNRSDLLSVVDDLSNQIDDQLRELSPEYKLLERGYRLPTPRMRQIELGVSLTTRPEPIEIREAITASNVIVISLGRNYPDNSLAWVLSNDLLTSDLLGKQPLPVVIDGLKIGPPRSTLTSLAQIDLSDFIDSEGSQTVFIINELPLKSRNRLRFLEEQIKEHPTSRFVIITREERLAIAESDFTTTLATKIFELAAVSFREITHFVQKNFGMTGSESEVIALRLRETFNKFNLSAHPSYFAGIPREILSALLQANQRAELIQLAVDGFLTFVVAGDTADIKLTRTTRLTFLQRLVVQMEVEKRTFTQADLVSFTKDFSTEFDFGINPLAFVTSFVDTGILHFVDDRVEFSLPFIKSYVLASKLVEDAVTAFCYFYASSDFDLHTFDLYAEMGPSVEIIDEVIGRLRQSVSDYKIPEGETHLLLTDRVRPALMKNPEQIDVIQNRLKKTVEDIEHGRGDIAQKQKMLDLADRVREEVADRAKPQDGDPRKEPDERIDIAIQGWFVGTVLLGAGAERLGGEVKQILAALLIEFSTIIAHRASEQLLTLDFEEVKSRLLSDSSVLETLKASGEDRDDAAVQKLVRSLVDVLEYSIFASSFRRVLAQLCEGARRKVLATSVEKAKVEGQMQKVIHAAWLTDIESRRGKVALVAAIKTLPPLPFLRTALAAHFASRVYWNHWKKEDRLVLLSAAEECLKGLGVMKAKAELIRIIEASEKPDVDAVD